MMPTEKLCWRAVVGPSRYNRQGRKAKERRSRDNHINRGNTRTQKVRNTGTYNQPLHLTRATIVTNDHSTLVFIGDLSPWRHLTARSSRAVRWRNHDTQTLDT